MANNQEKNAFDIWWERFYAEHCETPTTYEAWQAGRAELQSIQNSEKNDHVCATCAKNEGMGT